MKLERDPRLVDGKGLFASVVEYGRRIAQVVNPFDDSIAALNAAIGTPRAGAASITATLDGPAFSAYLASAQTGVTAGAYVQAVFGSEEFDTGSCYSTSNGRFQPTVAGYYQINASITAICSGGAFTNVQLALYKNGSAFKRLDVSLASNSTTWQASGCALIALNGSSDYVDARCFTGGGTGVSFDGDAGATKSHFSGHLARRA